MPAKKKTHRKRPRKKKGAFMGRGLALKRTNQTSTKTFYFKSAGRIGGDPSFQANNTWSTLLWLPGQPQAFPNIPGDYNVISRGYLQYKILAIKVVMYAANIGSEPNDNIDRGITCVWKDQQVVRGQPVPSQVLDVINLGSAKILPSRVSRWTTIIYRPRGAPEWGNCDIDTPTNQRVADSWSGAIHMVGNSVSNTLLWYWTANYKVIFRGRAYGGNQPAPLIPPP